MDYELVSPVARTITRNCARYPASISFQGRHATIYEEMSGDSEW